MTERWMKLCIAVVALQMGTTVSAVEYTYRGEMNFCLGTCDSFAAFGGEAGGSANTVNSIVTGTFDITPDVNGAFQIISADDASFAFAIENSAAPPIDAVFIDEDNLVNATTANPLPLNSFTGELTGSGQVGPTGQLLSGSLFFAFDDSPLSNNNGAFDFDLASGAADATILAGFITFARVVGGFSSATDTDEDGVLDGFDNCVNASNADQRDTNDDGFGNACDADLNNDCIVNVVDLGQLRSVFFAQNDDADFDGDGVVNIVDLGIMRSGFFASPGPSGTTLDCILN